jgi:hypothetical protein
LYLVSIKDVDLGLFLSIGFVFLVLTAVFLVMLLILYCIISAIAEQAVEEDIMHIRERLDMHDKYIGVSTHWGKALSVDKATFEERVDARIVKYLNDRPWLGEEPKFRG